MKKILIVDDLKPFVEQQKGILNRADVHIFTATSGSEALTIHKNVKVDLIVADLDMPGMAGDELCTAVRKDPDLRFVSILMVSRPRDADISRCLKCGANDYITKPINPNVLIEKTTNLLGVPIRKAYRVFVNMSVKGENSAHTNFLANSVNLSSTGILIETNRMLGVGDSVTCSLFLPGASAIHIAGEIVRTVKRPTNDTYQYGIKFTEITDSGRKLIDDFVKTRLPVNP